MIEAYYFLNIFFFSFKIKINDFQIFVILLNGQNLKTLLFQIIVIKIIFSLYLWANYETIGKDFTAQTVTLGASSLVKAQTIPQNAKYAFLKN